MTTLLNRGYANLFLKVRSFDIFQRKHLFILPWSNDIFHKGNCKVRWQKIRTWMSQKKFIQLYNIWGTRLSAEVKSWKQSPSRLNHYQVHWAEKTSNVETVVVVLFHPSGFFFFFKCKYCTTVTKFESSSWNSLTFHCCIRHDASSSLRVTVEMQFYLILLQWVLHSDTSICNLPKVKGVTFTISLDTELSYISGMGKKVSGCRSTIFSLW